MEQKNKTSVKHTFAIMSVLTMAGLFIWIVQLARQGELVGYVILIGVGATAFILIIALAFRILMEGVGTVMVGRSTSPNGGQIMKTIRDTNAVLAGQNRELARRLEHTGPAAVTHSPQLGPGQVMTASGFVIEADDFNVLDNE